ncbi:hypothetical protein K438DRAFT_1784208 [Mycena galopus ATCC 62051]|nr:hypothetical protein K438DRAFT_1784208 [Mycena galopus ATCC 62051]
MAPPSRLPSSAPGGDRCLWVGKTPVASHSSATARGWNSGLHRSQQAGRQHRLSSVRAATGGKIKNRDERRGGDLAAYGVFSMPLVMLLQDALPPLQPLHRLAQRLPRIFFPLLLTPAQRLCISLASPAPAASFMRRKSLRAPFFAGNIPGIAPLKGALNAFRLRSEITHYSASDSGGLRMSMPCRIQMGSPSQCCAFNTAPSGCNTARRSSPLLPAIGVPTPSSLSTHRLASSGVAYRTTATMHLHREKPSAASARCARAAPLSCHNPDPEDPTEKSTDMSIAFLLPPTASMPPPVLSDGSDSEGESFGNGDEEQQHLQLIDIDASKADIIAGYKSCQLELGRVLAENRSLRQRLSELEGTASSKRRQRDQSDNRLGYKAHVGPWARLFFLTKEGWVRKEDFRARPSEISLDPGARFTTNTAYSHAITSSLYGILPERFHSLLDSGHYQHLAKDVTSEISGARSSTINSLCGVIASILSSAGHTVNSQILGVAAADRSQDKVLLGLLRFPEDKTSKLFAPILFPKDSPGHGPSSLAANSKPDAKSNGIKYGVFEATDHSVALAGTLKGQARFLVSANKTFADVSATTKIKWEADYRIYRKLLASNPDAPFVRHIFKTVNSHVFAGVSKTVGRAEEDGADNVEAEISDVMQHLAFSDFDDPTGSDDDDPVGETDPRDSQPAVAGPSPPVSRKRPHKSM